MTVNITKYIFEIPQIKQLIAAIVLVFLACSAYSVYESSEQGTYDIFSDKAKTEIKTMMDHALKYPTEGNLRTANNKLYIIEWRWLSQNEGVNKELFTTYLNECQLVIDEKQAGHDAKEEIDKMNELYGQLVPEK